MYILHLFQFTIRITAAWPNSCQTIKTAQITPLKPCQIVDKHVTDIH